MRKRRNITNQRHTKSSIMNTTNRRFSSRTRAPNIDTSFSPTLFQAFLSGRLCCGFCCEGSTLTSTTEPTSTRRTPSNHAALRRADGNDGVIVSRLNMNNSFRNFSFGLFCGRYFCRWFSHNGMDERPQAKLSLALFMLWIGTNDPNFATTANEATFFTNFFHRRTNLHRR